ncbi:MAG: hypothetical protein A3H91_05190 [Gammaproteobacteria bacterium RIFCSPLOWO2_02_FULL_61_13]|nr:MAG: hypothetical protein A3H91_05190 [Gammaproteobacteria bacterium RIFCSPLOWO2_02_FULL_61_13]
MAETIGWIALLGLGVCAAWIYLFSIKLEQNMRDTIAILIRSNEHVMTQLGRITGKQVEQPELTLREKRRFQRRGPRFHAQQQIAGPFVEQRGSCGRRVEDLYSAG